MGNWFVAWYSLLGFKVYFCDTKNWLEFQILLRIFCIIGFGALECIGIVILKYLSYSPVTPSLLVLGHKGRFLVFQSLSGEVLPEML